MTETERSPISVWGCSTSCSNTSFVRRWGGASRPPHLFLRLGLKIFFGFRNTFFIKLT